MAETKKKSKLSIEEKIARREKMAQKNSNELKLLKRKLSEQKRKERDRRIYEKGAVFESIIKERLAFSKDDYSQLLIYAKSLNGFMQKVSELSKKSMENRRAKNSKRKKRKARNKPPLFTRAQLYTLKGVLASCGAFSPCKEQKRNSENVRISPFPLQIIREQDI